MDSLLKRIIQEIVRPYHRLSIVCNPDGFLSREDTIHAMNEQAGIAILCFTQLELRVWYETSSTLRRVNNCQDLNTKPC